MVKRKQTRIWQKVPVDEMEKKNNRKTVKQKVNKEIHPMSHFLSAWAVQKINYLLTKRGEFGFDQRFSLTFSLSPTLPLSCCCYAGHALAPVMYMGCSKVK